MKLTTLSLVVVGTCVATTAELSAAADTVYRSGDFGRADVEMTTCPGYVLVKRHPEIHYLMGTTSAGASWCVSCSMSTKAYIWMIIAKPTGSKSSHVDLHNKSAKTEEMEEVWQVDCARK